ncbi:MAG: hypothetical protein IKW21_00445 [Lachnospiraceae bacterium]|nr:hypothetical protein [Lachnospiraceae bacterium]
MNELQIFEHEKLGKIRTTIIDDEPWFVGKDVASALHYRNPSKAITDHVHEDDKLNNEMLSSLGQRGGWLINESGMYSLIFGSKLDKAKEFKHWVTSEVLPTLRKTGHYSMSSPSREEYLKVAQMVVKCPNKRIPVLLSVLSKAGFDFTDTQEKTVVVETVKKDNSDAEMVALMKRFSVKQLIDILHLPRTSIYYYRSGQCKAPADRKNFIINTLKQVSA